VSARAIGQVVLEALVIALIVYVALVAALTGYAS